MRIEIGARSPGTPNRMLPLILNVAWLILPVGTWGVNLFRRNRIHPALICIVTVMLGCVLFLASIWILEIQLEAKMNSFDLDGDGVFSGDELTPAAEIAMAEWTSDTGRSFGYILGIPFTIIWYAILFSIAFSAEWVFRRFNPVTAVGDPKYQEEKIGNPEPLNSDNPYQSPNAV